MPYGCVGWEVRKELLCWLLGFSRVGTCQRINLDHKASMSPSGRLLPHDMEPSMAWIRVCDDDVVPAGPAPAGNLIDTGRNRRNLPLAFWDNEENVSAHCRQVQR